MTAAPFAKSVAYFAALLLATGCTGKYFRPAPIPTEPVRHTLAALPFDEYWTGIVFNGSKVGFSHLAISREEDDFRLRAEAALRFRFLTVDKRVVLKASERLAADLSLRTFEYDYDMDGNRLRLAGRVEQGELIVTVQNGGETRHETFPLNGPIHSTNGMGLYPVVHGLEVGRQYRFAVFDGEAREIAWVEQEVVAYEESELFQGRAHRVRSTLHGQTVDTWFNGRGEPILEMSLGGVIIAALEDEVRARRYLAEAAFNKDEALLGFSLIPAGPLPSDGVQSMEVLVSGTPWRLPSDGTQVCRERADGTLCRIDRSGAPPVSPGDPLPFLKPSFAAPSGHPAITDLAARLGGDGDPRQRIEAALAWMEGHIEKSAVDGFTALDVLRSRKAECQGHSYLFAALARAQGIPTRIVNGVVYSSAHQGFLYHTWTESWLDGRWVPVDPTFGQLPADATHIKLLEGETPADLAPLTGVIGRLRIDILRTE